MLYYLSHLLMPYISCCNVVHYISFRAAAALFTAFAFSLLLGKRFIAFSERFLRAQARENTPASHQVKNNVPTMGGVLIIVVTLLSLLLWGNHTSRETWLLGASLIAFGFLGGWDDWSKIKYKKGISEGIKFRFQIFIALGLGLLWYVLCNPHTELVFPLFKNIMLPLGWGLVLWAVFVMVATSNAVNLTDGLDGLAISSLILNFATFSAIAYMAGHYGFAQYLHIPFTNTAEIAVMGAALVGASLGFLWFNAYPAHMFMGDAGALALGGTLGLFALMTKHELLLAIAGGLFVIETLSVIIQVGLYKRTGTRLFKMAPLHHHFELIGWKEPQIMIRFTIITFLLCICALLTLKIR